MSEHDRLRWHCRRGMLELDLVLQRFLQNHLAVLDAERLRAFEHLLDASDPELLDLVMGRAEAVGPQEREVLELMRAGTNAAKNAEASAAVAQSVS